MPFSGPPHIWRNTICSTTSQQSCKCNYELFVSRIRECTNTTNELAERIKESDIYSREIPDATREFEEVARKHVLSRIPKDIKIDASEIKMKDIKYIWAGGDMGID